MMNMNRASSQWRAPTRVRTIPIHFVGSERSRDDSAIKIQKVLRGFFVRNALKRILGLGLELQNVEAKVYASMEVIKRDQRERVRLSETIMNLLLKLDSVTVLSSCYGVRDCRRSVIKQAIALQEMLEADSGSVVVEEEKKMEVLEDSGAEKCVSETCKNSCVEEKEEEKMEVMDDSGKEDTKCVSETCNIEEDGDGDGEREESVGTSLVEENENENDCVVKDEEEEEEKKEEEEERREGKHHKEMLEKMMEDNERMMKMMAKLCEKNEMQTQLLTSLSKRVELLERVFACDRMRRTKRRNCSDAKHKQQQNMNK